MVYCAKVLGRFVKIGYGIYIYIAYFIAPEYLTFIAFLTNLSGAEGDRSEALRDPSLQGLELGLVVTSQGSLYMFKGVQKAVKFGH